MKKNFPSKILVVEDELFLRELLESILLEQGYAVQFAKDGGEAFAFIDGTEFDIIIVDMTIPKACGLDIIDYASRKYPRIKSILMSGYDITEQQLKNMEKLSCRFLSKPFKLGQISRLIEEIIEER